MNRCPITYKECGRSRYSDAGLRGLSTRLRDLNDFPYSAEKQRREAVARAGKMSIQGVQPKLSVKLSVRDGVFVITDRGGRYIVKPQHHTYPELPENEDLTMRLAEHVSITSPFHGLIYCNDGTLSYFCRRFDRFGQKSKYAVEDFAQLSGEGRETKYESSIEKVIEVINEYCSFPLVERTRLFRRLIFTYLTGNEDMHLKNFSLITIDSKVELSPAYDMVNTTLALMSIGKQFKAIEETALPINGKKRNLTRRLLIEYLGMERLELRQEAIDAILSEFSGTLDVWREMIGVSFLSSSVKKEYCSIVEQRARKLKL